MHRSSDFVYITNASNQEIEIWSEHSYYGTYKCSLRHGESLKIAQDISSNLPKEFGEVINNHLEVSIGKKTVDYGDSGH